MKNPPGLVHIETGGSASNTMITIDDVMPMVKRCTIIIDPEQGENQIKLHTWSRQNNKMYDDGKVQSFFGISAENYEFFKTLMKLVSEIPDSDLTDRWPSNGIPPRVMDMLDYIHKARHAEDANEPDSKQP